MRSVTTAFLSLLVLAAQVAAAQDLPTRVGRVAHIEGPVSIYQDPEQGWDKAYVNSPITSENSLWTDPGARAEVRIGGLALRLGETTQLDVSHLDDDGIDAHVERGTAVIRLRHFDRNEKYRFTTPHGSFRLLADGRYRIDVDPEREQSRLTVTSGAAELESPRGGVRIPAGRSMVVFGGASPSYAFEGARSDAFDRWADARDKQWSEATSTRYVNSDMTGYEDLDRYGRWVEEPDYGAIWYPTRVASNWAPYRHGHWSYVRPWGWTWIDDQPWGYAPSHYGRWVYVGNRWGWHPGERAQRQVWAPALVGWIGGSNWSVGVTSGARAPAVGWYPLSPWERYEPWYRASPAYVNRINVVVRDRDRAPRNWQGRGDDWRRNNRDRGATVVQRDVFIQRKPVAQAMVQVTQDVVRQQPQAQAANVLPTRNELQRARTQQRPAAQQQPAAAPQGGVQRGERAAGDDRGNRLRRDESPNFARKPAAQAPVPAAQAPQPKPGAPRSTADVMNPGGRNLPQQSAPAQAPQGNALGRSDGKQREQQERAAREAQQNLQREQQQREQQQRATREAQQQQERAAKEAQQNQLQRQNQEREQQQRAAREAQQQKERAAKEAQQNQLQRQNQQAEQQQRAAREAQQQKERTAKEAQQRAAQQQERATKEAAQVQQQARETLNQLQRQPREAQPKAEAPQNRAPRGGDKGEKEKADKEKADKEKTDKEKADKPDREERGGGRQR